MASGARSQRVRAFHPQKRFVIEILVIGRVLLFGYFWSDLYIIFGSGVGLINSLKSGARESDCHTSDMPVDASCSWHRKSVPWLRLEHQRAANSE